MAAGARIAAPRAGSARARPPRSAARGAALLVALAVVATSCGGGGGGGGGGGASIADLKEGRPQLSLLQAQASLTTGTSPFSFGLVTADGKLVQGGAPEVWVARDERAEPLGPFRATFHRFTAYARFGDTSPRSPLGGFYSAAVRIPEAGNWAVAAVVEAERGGVGTGAMEVEPADEAIAAVGSEALSVETPVATTVREGREICTRTPRPDPLHYISLDDALANGKPTVVNFGTPLLCESRMCGPVVDEVMAAHEEVGRERANFIHVEVFPPGEDLRPPPATEEHTAESFRAWGFGSEPWTLVIDREGVIRGRFEGPVVASQILEALRPLL